MEVSKSFVKFLMNDVLPDYMIYSRKENYAFCTHCQTQVNVDLSNSKPKDTIVCSKCKRTTILKAKGQTKYPFGDGGVGIMLDKDMCVRYFDVHKTYQADGTLFSGTYKECLREYFDENGLKEAYDNSWNFGWKKCNIRRYSNYKGIAGEPIYHINVNWKYRNNYTKNLSKVIKGTLLEHSCMDKIFKLPDKHHYWDVMRAFIKEYVKCPASEYLYKVGFFKLVDYNTFDALLSLDRDAKTLPNILRVDKVNYKKLLTIGNPTVDDLRKYQEMSLHKIYTEDDYRIWEKYFKKDSHKMYYRYDTDPASEFRKYFTKSWQQLEKYADKVINFNATTYTDYLKMCTDLGYDLKNTFVLFPKYLNDAHQRVVTEWNLKNNPKAREQAKARNAEYNELRDKYSEQYAFAEDNLQIVVPKGCEDICAEGQTLHHCVGTYIDKVCKGISIILFVRDINEIDASFYTMEVRQGEIIQCRGFQNKVVTPEVKSFITKFATQKKLVMDRIA